MSTQARGDRSPEGVDELLERKTADLEASEKEKEEEKGRRTTGVLEEYKKNSVRIESLTQESAQIDEDIARIQTFIREHPEAKDDELTKRLQSLADRKKEVEKEISSLTSDNRGILRNMESDPEKIFRSDVKPDLMRKIVSDKAREHIERNLDHFGVNLLGDKQNIQYLRASPDFMAWVNEKAAEIRQKAEEEITQRETEILNQFKELGRPRFDRGKEPSFYQVSDTAILPHITYEPYIKDYIREFNSGRGKHQLKDPYFVSIKNIQESRAKDAKRFLASMRGASKDTLQAQDHLVRYAQSLIDSLRKFPRDNEVSERTALRNMNEPVTRENCEDVAQQIIAYYNAEESKDASYSQDLERYARLVHDNNKVIKYKQDQITNVDAVVKELKEK